MVLQSAFAAGLMITASGLNAFIRGHSAGSRVRRSSMSAIRRASASLKWRAN